MKVAKLAGARLNQWVAKATGLALLDNAMDGAMRDGILVSDQTGVPRIFNPCREWADGGPIIESEGLAIFSYMHEGQRFWGAHRENESPFGTHGSTSPLVAGMRAFVASKFGDEVPDEHR